MKSYFSIFVLSFILLFACQGRHKSSDALDKKPTQTDTVATTQEADSTIYGISDEFGMSTFTLISDNGDTLNVCRTANDGTDGKIYGDLVENNRYAMTTRDNGEAIGTLINLTQLENHTKDYQIINGQVLINGKCVEITALNNKDFIYK